MRQVVLRLLLEGGLLHGDVMTVTGNTMADNLRAVAPLAADQDVIVPLSQPVAPAGRLAAMRIVVRVLRERTVGKLPREQL